jgi:hypothetical protein
MCSFPSQTQVPADELFKRLSPSVFIVETFGTLQEPQEFAA